MKHNYSIDVKNFNEIHNWVNEPIKINPDDLDQTKAWKETEKRQTAEWIQKDGLLKMVDEWGCESCKICLKIILKKIEGEKE